MKQRTKITGAAALEYAKRHGTTLYKHADPVDGAREVTLTEAEQVAKEDASLIYTWAADLAK